MMEKGMDEKRTLEISGEAEFKKSRLRRWNQSAILSSNNKKRETNEKEKKRKKREKTNNTLSGREVILS
jgi:hypothetical protein